MILVYCTLKENVSICQPGHCSYRENLLTNLARYRKCSKCNVHNVNCIKFNEVHVFPKTPFNLLTR